MKYPILSSASFLALTLSLASWADDFDCVKMVFNEICLGGPALPGAYGYEFDKAKGWSTKEFNYGEYFQYFIEQDDHIVEVGRVYNAATSALYQELTEKLTGVYGEPLDHTKWPKQDYESLMDISALVLGGIVRIQNEYPADDDYSVLLTWQQMRLDLVYRDARYEDQNREGF